MGFSNKIEIVPGIETTIAVSLMVFKDVRSTTIRKSRRYRECYYCGHPIRKDEKYVNHQFRYDGRIITISFHKECFKK